MSKYSEKELSSKNYADLLVLCNQEDISIPDKTPKRDVIALLLAVEESVSTDSNEKLLNEESVSTDSNEKSLNEESSNTGKMKFSAFDIELSKRMSSKVSESSLEAELQKRKGCSSNKVSFEEELAARKNKYVE